MVAHDGGLRWQVKSSRFYARDSKQGRAFLANWFENRCTGSDQYPLWHTMLEFAASEGCVPYDGDIFGMRYSEAKHLKADDAPARLLLDCRTIDEACPSFPYARRNNNGPDEGTGGLRGGLDEALRRRGPRRVRPCDRGVPPSNLCSRRRCAGDDKSLLEKGKGPFGSTLVFKDGGDIARRFGEAAASVGAIVDTVVLADAAYYVGVEIVVGSRRRCDSFRTGTTSATRASRPSTALW